MPKRFERAVVIILSVCLCAACGGPAATPPPATPTPVGYFAPDPIFLEWLEDLQRMQMMGPAISPVIHEGSITRQYFVGGELIFDPYAPKEEVFSLASVALQHGISQPPVPIPAMPELKYSNGHVIYPDFLPAIEGMGGLLWTGQPLTDASYNLIFRRYEQYFENVGFYRMEGDSQVHLLAYGAWSCQDQCSQVGVTKQNVVPIDGFIEPPFQGYVSEVGADITGYPVVPAYTNAEGKWQLVLEHMLLEAQQRTDPNSVSPLPLPELLDITPEAPLPYSNDPNMYFYSTDGNTGYEIPIYFWDYLEQHGGIEVSGPPITHYALLQPQMYHQCFSNLCLVYDLTMYPEARIHPEPLGYAYVVKFPSPDQLPTETPAATMPPATVVPTLESSPVAPVTVSPEATAATQATAAPQTAGEQPGMREIALHVWAQYSSVDTQKQQGQMIGIWVMENGRPLENTTPVLVLNSPDGSSQTYEMPPTTPNGQSSLLLPEIKAENGAVFPYRVCITAAEGLRVCGASFFVIWNNP